MTWKVWDKFKKREVSWSWEGTQATPLLRVCEDIVRMKGSPAIAMEILSFSLNIPYSPHSWFTVHSFWRLAALSVPLLLASRELLRFRDPGLRDTRMVVQAVPFWIIWFDLIWKMKKKNWAWEGDWFRSCNVLVAEPRLKVRSAVSESLPILSLLGQSYFLIKRSFWKL